jgi:anti-sigma regulatory factor (Ser/Thr protein kinase)
MDERLLVMEFQAQMRNVDIARSALQEVCSTCFGEDLVRAGDIVSAANEAMNNAVEHTDSPLVTLHVTRDDGSLTVFVTSSGPSFDPVTAAAKLNEKDMLKRGESGYGLYLIRELTDSFEYEYRDSRNIWKLRKNFHI